MELVQIYFKNCNKITNFFHAFFFYYFSIFPFGIRIRILNANPGGKTNADKCGSESRALDL